MKTGPKISLFLFYHILFLFVFITFTGGLTTTAAIAPGLEGSAVASTAVIVEPAVDEM